MQAQVIEILSELCGAGPGELEPDMDLFGNGLLDSFGVVQLLVKLEERFGLALDIESFSRAEIATPALICGIVEKLL
jgi:D-alanine--poly(phosphoribitol) ligase subunit 2